MSSICSEQKSSDSQFVRATLVNLVRAEVDHVVLAGIRSAWNESLVLLRLAFQHLLPSEVGVFTVGDSTQAIVRDLRDHWKMLRVDHEVRARLPAEFFQSWIIHLFSRLSSRARCGDFMVRMYGTKGTPACQQLQAHVSVIFRA